MARSFLALLAPLVFAAVAGRTGGLAWADWEIHPSSKARTGQAERALAAHPENAGLAAQALSGLGKREEQQLIASFQRAANERPWDGAARMAYAQLLLAAHRWPEAAAEFGRAAELLPGSVAARRGQARALDRSGDRRGAVAALRAALALARSPADRITLAGALVEASVAAGDTAAEVEALRTSVAVRPSARSTWELAAALARAGRPGEAAEVLAAGRPRFAPSGSEGTRWTLVEARHRLAAGDLTGATPLLAQGRRQPAAPSIRAEIWTESIEVARRSGSLAELRAELAEPRDAVTWNARARVAEETGDLRDAWLALDHAVRLGAGDVELQRRRIEVARRVATASQLAGLYEELARSATAMTGDRAGAVAEALDGLWQLNRPETARNLFDRQLAIGRGDVVLLRTLAEQAGHWGDERRAEAALKRLLALSPRDEMGIIALGEAEFQRGHRREAVATWRNLVRGAGGLADGHARFAEVLRDHELDGPALDEARAAVALQPEVARYHRLLASILEREPRITEAEREWETVLKLAAGPGDAPERREAHSHLVALWLREGDDRIERRLEELNRRVQENAHDAEALSFLIEAQLRTGRIDAAIASLKASLSLEASASGPASEQTAEVMWLLVRTLREARRLDEAIWWLEELAQRCPDHARDARLQLVDIALATHADERAQAFARQAAADGDDPRASLRVAAVEERLGHFDQAMALYRRAAEGSRDPSSALLLASLLTRVGEVEQQRTLLRQVLASSSDDELVLEAGRRAIVLEEAQGTLEALEAEVAATDELNASGGGGPARRRVLAAMLGRLVPPAYRGQATEPAARLRLERFARDGVRPLLDLISVSDSDAEAGAIELLGMLGRREAVPALVRVVLRELEPTDARGPGRAERASTSELVVPAVIALGRLGGDEARAALERLAKQEKANLRLPLLWALGRVGGPASLELARRAVTGMAADAASLGCLALGRAPAADAEAILVSVARDPARPESVRRAAILGLWLGRHRTALPTLVRLAQSEHPALAGAAADAVAALGGGGEGEGGAGASCATAGLPDEALAITGGSVDPDELLRGVFGAPTSLSQPPSQRMSRVGGACARPASAPAALP